MDLTNIHLETAREFSSSPVKDRFSIDNPPESYENYEIVHPISEADSSVHTNKNHNSSDEMISIISDDGNLDKQSVCMRSITSEGSNQSSKRIPLVDTVECRHKEHSANKPERDSICLKHHFKQCSLQTRVTPKGTKAVRREESAINIKHQCECDQDITTKNKKDESVDQESNIEEHQIASNRTDRLSESSGISVCSLHKKCTRVSPSHRSCKQEVSTGQHPVKIHKGLCKIKASMPYHRSRSIEHHMHKSLDEKLMADESEKKLRREKSCQSISENDMCTICSSISFDLTEENQAHEHRRTEGSSEISDKTYEIEQITLVPKNVIIVNHVLSNEDIETVHNAQKFPMTICDEADLRVEEKVKVPSEVTKKPPAKAMIPELESKMIASQHKEVSDTDVHTAHLFSDSNVQTAQSFLTEEERTCDESIIEMAQRFTPIVTTFTHKSDREASRKEADSDLQITQSLTEVKQFISPVEANVVQLAELKSVTSEKTAEDINEYITKIFSALDMESTRTSDIEPLVFKEAKIMPGKQPLSNDRSLSSASTKIDSSTKDSSITSTEAKFYPSSISQIEVPSERFYATKPLLGGSSKSSSLNEAAVKATSTISLCSMATAIEGALTEAAKSPSTPTFQDIFKALNLQTAKELTILESERSSSESEIELVDASTSLSTNAINVFYSNALGINQIESLFDAEESTCKSETESESDSLSSETTNTSDSDIETAELWLMPEPSQQINSLAMKSSKSVITKTPGIETNDTISWLATAQSIPISTAQSASETSSKTSTLNTRTISSPITINAVPDESKHTEMRINDLGDVHIKSQEIAKSSDRILDTSTAELFLPEDIQTAYSNSSISSSASCKVFGPVFVITSGSLKKGEVEDDEISEKAFPISKLISPELSEDMDEASESDISTESSKPKSIDATQLSEKKIEKLPTVEDKAIVSEYADADERIVTARTPFTDAVSAGSPGPVGDEFFFLHEEHRTDEESGCTTARSFKLTMNEAHENVKSVEQGTPKADKESSSTSKSLKHENSKQASEKSPSSSSTKINTNVSTRSHKCSECGTHAHKISPSIKRLCMCNVCKFSLCLECQNCNSSREEFCATCDYCILQKKHVCMTCTKCTAWRKKSCMKCAGCKSKVNEICPMCFAKVESQFSSFIEAEGKSTKQSASTVTSDGSEKEAYHAVLKKKKKNIVSVPKTLHEFEMKACERKACERKACERKACERGHNLEKHQKNLPRKVTEVKMGKTDGMKITVVKNMEDIDLHLNTEEQGEESADDNLSIEGLSAPKDIKIRKVIVNGKKIYDINC